jgi:hypothetical protein
MPDLDVLSDPRRISPPPAERTLAKVSQHSHYIACMEGAIARDKALPPLTSVKNRGEATRLTSLR